MLIKAQGIRKSFGTLEVLKGGASASQAKERALDLLEEVGLQKTPLQSQKWWSECIKKPGTSKGSWFFVRMVRVELTRANAHYPLKVACLPFHHIRSCFGTAKISQILKIAKFF